MKEKISDVVAERIRMARREMKLNQSEFGRLVNMAQTTVSGWEKGETAPNFELLGEISRLTGHSIGWFFGEEQLSFGDEDLSKRKLSLDPKNDVHMNTQGVIIESSRDNHLNGRLAQLENTDLAILEALKRVADAIENMREDLSEVKSNLARTTENLNQFALEQEKGEILALDSYKVSRKNEQLAKINYLLEMGEITVQEATSRVKKVFTG